MLYHPCANRLEVNRLRDLVSRCLWRHVITPCSDLDEDYVSTRGSLNLLHQFLQVWLTIVVPLLQPLALLSWGCKLAMSYVNPAVVTRFIRERALNGPERMSTDGQFKDALLKPSNLVTDPTDSRLCPGIH